VLSRVDGSIRFPALFFVVSAMLWLAVGTALSLISALQSYQPDFMSNCEFITYGRLTPAAANAMLYGWGCNVIFAVGLWIIARLSLAPVRSDGLLIVAGMFWNLGISVGLFGILAGHLTSAAGLELPGYATPILLIAYAFIGAWGIVAFRGRQAQGAYVSQWYILGALFWFPWFYTIAEFLVVWFPARGVVQSITAAWFTGNVVNLWLTPMALATAYYVIPKVLGRPIHSYNLALLGFCSLALIGSWTGVAQLIGGPVPIWVSSVGIVASVMMVVPVITNSLNLYLSVRGARVEIWRSPALRFVMFGVLSYFFASMLGSAMTFRSVSEVIHFTTFADGQLLHLTYGFFSMVMFGGLYFMLPRLTKVEWPFATLIFLHFWASALGVTISVVALLLGGWISGIQMNDAAVPFIEVVQTTTFWLKVRSIGEVCLTIGHTTFAIHFFWMLFATGSIRSKQGPTLLEPTNKEGAA
jgi:cytochrome c oxidase cbb3-type subunit 1